jgi:hypothetical protein
MLSAGNEVLPSPNNPEDANRILSFLHASRAICQAERDLMEKKLWMYIRGVEIFRQELERAQARLVAADAHIGSVRANIREKGFPVISHSECMKHSVYDDVGFRPDYTNSEV